MSLPKHIKNLFEGKEIETVSHYRSKALQMLYINLDEECNENCVFCVVKGTNVGKFGSMESSQVKSMIRNFVKSGGKNIVFTGGEPTLRNDLPEIIKYTEGFKEIDNISIITNGVRLSDRQYFLKITASDKRKILNFSISFHSHKKKISEKLTQGYETYKKTIQGITNAVKSKYQVTIYQVITSINYKDLLEFCKFLNKKFPEIKNITLAYVFPQGNALNNLWVFPRLSALRPYLLKALKYLKQNHYFINIAACGQFPLCLVPGFEVEVINNVYFSEQNILGVVGEKTFHEFEMADKNWIEQYKSKNVICKKCILNTICSGFWSQYIQLFGFDGIKPITWTNFKGNKIEAKLNNGIDVENIQHQLNNNKLNMIRLKSYKSSFLKRLIQNLNNGADNKTFFVIINKYNQILFPQ
jgi:MoaA/NifB/PqqE/SkfB family radical SAM enzyme